MDSCQTYSNIFFISKTIVAMTSLKIGVIPYLVHLQNSPSLFEIYLTSVISSHFPITILVSSTVVFQLVIRIVSSWFCCFASTLNFIVTICLSKTGKVHHFTCNIVPLLLLADIHVATKKIPQTIQDTTFCSSLEFLPVSHLTFEKWLFLLIIKGFIHDLTFSSV